MDVGDVVDLDPAVVRAIEQRVGYVAIIFDRQPCYSRAVGEAPKQVPLYNCEIRVWDAQIELMQVILPFETTDWEVRFNGGSRSCFLPTSFTAEGPIKVTIGPAEAPQIVVSGSRVVLELGDKVGTFEQGLAP